MGTRKTIVVIEDNDDDFEACAEALSLSSRMVNPLIRFETGDLALDYLYKRNEYATSSHELPGLILLDLKLPGISGHEVLLDIKASAELRSIPVVVMTSSRDEIDINDSYKAGANSYVVKPVDLRGFVEALTRLRDYWFEIVVLPGN